MDEKLASSGMITKSNWTQSLSELRNDKESADITLISEDKVKFSAHKIILSSCSKTFKFILQGNFHANPILYLSGVNSVNLGFILDYIYYGEVNLFQEQLDSFLTSAQKLEIEGLLGDNRDQDHEALKEQNVDQVNENKGLAGVEDDENVPVKPRNYSRAASSNNEVAKFDAGSMTAEEINLKKNELYQKIDGVWSCLACSYTTSRTSGHMRSHVETHMEGLCYTCTLCNKEFRSKDTLSNHRYRKHK